MEVKKGFLEENILMLGKIEGRRRRGQQRMRWLDGITDAMDCSLPGSSVHGIFLGGGGEAVLGSGGTWACHSEA